MTADSLRMKTAHVPGKPAVIVSIRPTPVRAASDGSAAHSRSTAGRHSAASVKTADHSDQSRMAGSR
jgi:hypothetical protein